MSAHLISILFIKVRFSGVCNDDDVESGVPRPA